MFSASRKTLGLNYPSKVGDTFITKILLFYDRNGYLVYHFFGEMRIESGKNDATNILNEDLEPEQVSVLWNQEESWC